MGNVGLQYVHVHALGGVPEPQSLWISWIRQRTLRRNNKARGLTNAGLCWSFSLRFVSDEGWWEPDVLAGARGVIG